jgi:rod shape-determining protein MreC
VLLGLSLLLPLVLPAGGGLRAVLGGALSWLPPLGASEAETVDEAARWRDAYYRELARNAELLSRLLALGDPANLVSRDPAYWRRNPLRIEAEVVARDSSPWRGSVTISAGAREGVKPGCPVVVGERLVGLTAEVGPITTRVRLLSDPGLRIWAEILTGDERRVEGCVAGNGGGIEMLRVPAGSAERGSPVMTAGGSILVPRDLLIGSVESIDDVDRSGLAEVVVSPAADPAAIRFVNVLVAEDD